MILRRYLSFDITVHTCHEEDMTCKKCGLIGIDWGSVEYTLSEKFLELGAEVDVKITPVNEGDSNDNS